MRRQEGLCTSGRPNILMGIDYENNTNNTSNEKNKSG